MFTLQISVFVFVFGRSFIFVLNSSVKIQVYLRHCFETEDLLCAFLGGLGLVGWSISCRVTALLHPSFCSHQRL